MERDLRGLPTHRDWVLNVNCAIYEDLVKQAQGLMVLVQDRESQPSEVPPHLRVVYNNALRGLLEACDRDYMSGVLFRPVNKEPHRLGNAAPDSVMQAYRSFYSAAALIITSK